MKLQLETIQYAKAQTSFHFFQREATHFPSYWHYHSEMELTFIARGQGIRYVGDHIGEFAAEDLVLLGEYLPHDYVTVHPKPRQTAIAYVFQFPKTIVDALPEGQHLRALLKTAQLGIHFPQLSSALLKKIKHCVSLSPFKRYLLLLELLHDLSEHPHQHSISSIGFHKTNKNQQQQSKVAQVTQYILHRLDQPLRLNQVAQFAGMTPPSFCRWFKQAVGRSFITYLNISRIERACQLLIQTEAPITQIAYQAGFETIGHFNRTFKKWKAVSPRQYRRQRFGQSS